MSSNLRAINLSNAHIGDDGVCCLIPALIRMDQIRELVTILSLTDNTFTHALYVCLCHSCRIFRPIS